MSAQYILPEINGYRNNDLSCCLNKDIKNFSIYKVCIQGLVV